MPGTPSRRLTALTAVKAAVAACLVVAVTAVAAPPASAQSQVPPVAAIGEQPYAYLSATAAGPDRWYPCTPTHFRINPAGARPADVRLLRKAVDSIAQATGLVWIYDGPTDVAPIDDLFSAQSLAGTDVLLAFARLPKTPKAGQLLNANMAGLGGRELSPPLEGGWARAGAAVFNANALTTLSPGFRWVLFAHELGHVIGLDHVLSDSVMVPTLTLRPTWSPGDSEGLKSLGRQPGECGNPNDAATPTSVPAPPTQLGVMADSSGVVSASWLRPATGSRATAYQVTTRVVSAYGPAQRTDLVQGTVAGPVTFQVPLEMLAAVPSDGHLEVLVRSVNAFGSSAEVLVTVPAGTGMEGPVPPAS